MIRGDALRLRRRSCRAPWRRQRPPSSRRRTRWSSSSLSSTWWWRIWLQLWFSSISGTITTELWFVQVMRAQLDLAQVRQEIDRRIQEKEEEFENTRSDCIDCNFQGNSKTMLANNQEEPCASLGLDASITWGRSPGKGRGAEDQEETWDGLLTHLPLCLFVCSFAHLPLCLFVGLQNYLISSTSNVGH